MFSEKIKSIITIKRIVIIVIVCLIAYVSFVQLPLPCDYAYAGHSQIQVKQAATGRSELLLLDCNGSVRNTTRELTRDGESVCVVFFYCTKPLLGRFAGNVISSEPDYNTTVLEDRAADDELKTVEVYYLPANYSSVSELSNESFDAKRLDGFLIWSGLI